MRRSQLMVPGLLPYRVLFTLLVATAVVAAVLGMLSPDDLLRTADVVIALLMTALGFAVLLLGPRVRNGRALDAATLLIIVMASAGAAIVPDGEGQVLVGLGLTMFTAFAALFRPTGPFLVTLAVAVVTYTFAAVLNRQTTLGVTIIAVDVLLIGTSVMIHQLVQRQHRLAIIDPLTRAFNRRGMEALTPSLAAAAMRGGLPVTVGVIDLDDFKAYNDRHGHREGDDLLVEVADAWREAARRSDLVVRFGGDEFVVVLLGVTPEDAEEVATRVGQPEGGSWTAGFTAWDPAEDIYLAIQRADHAMYSRKNR